MDTLREVAEILRQTLRSVEHNTDLSPDDPALLELKRILNHRIAVLEAAATPEPHIGLPTIGRKPPFGPD